MFLFVPIALCFHETPLRICLLSPLYSSPSGVHTHSQEPPEPSLLQAKQSQLSASPNKTDGPVPSAS